MAVNLTSADEVNLLKGVIRFKPGYLEPHASKGFEDVVLVSREGDRYPINACIFASLSHVTRRIIRDVGDDDVTTLVLTDLSRYMVVMKSILVQTQLSETRYHPASGTSCTKSTCSLPLAPSMATKAWMSFFATRP